MYNTIKSYLCNRKFYVRANNHESQILPLFNGIPQGSPLSVILFIIAFNEVNSIISKHLHVEHFIYADDVVIFSNTKNLSEVKSTFSGILADLEVWSQASGASISINKSSTFHICRKHKCIFPPISFSNTIIPHTNTLKILGIIFDKRLTYKQHCEYVRLSLLSRLNIVKYLSSKHCLIHTSTLLSITRSLILSKIDFGLVIYGHCAKTHLKRLEAPYHAAVRRSIRAFPTSPINVTLAEAGLPTISERVANNTRTSILKIIQCRNRLLFKHINSSTQKLNRKSRESTISIILKEAEKLDIIAQPVLVEPAIHPPWVVPNSMILNNLSKHLKDSTNTNEYNQIFLETISPLKKDWEIIFTDGSKTDTCTSFAVTNAEGVTIYAGILPRFTSIFTAEAAALLEAVIFASQKCSKHLICTDSKSSIEAILNPTNDTPMITKIRNIISIHTGAIKIMWIPGHSGINGNEKADKRAKEANKEPLHTFDYITCNDIKILAKELAADNAATKWNIYQHPYKNFNPFGGKNIYPPSALCHQAKIFTRLRIGHTLMTHAHLLSGSPKPTCPFCGSNEFTTLHLIDTCPSLQNIRTSFFSSIKPSELLKQTTVYNLNKICDYVSRCKLRL